MAAVHIQAVCLWGQNPRENTKKMNVLITFLTQVHTIATIGSTATQIILTLEPGRSIILLCHSLILLWQKEKWNMHCFYTLLQMNVMAVTKCIVLLLNYQPAMSIKIQLRGHSQF